MLLLSIGSIDNREDHMTWKTTTQLTIAAVLALTALAGCAAFDKTRPHDLTVQGHERAAAAEEVGAAQAAQDAKAGGRGAQYAQFIAPRRKELAKSHRAAARALQDEAVRACDGIPTATAAAAMAGARVASVDEIRQGTEPPVVHSARGFYPEYLLGAKIAIQGEANPADLERMMACRIARAAAEGDDGVDPIAVKGARVRVLAQGGGPLAVEIRAGDQPTAAEVVRRARLLAAR